ncbi:tetratricopeptide repeat protein [Aequorivita echinoideorum]|uniref:Tetratricopeptide repeat protein n=1 Tax=Aequorivita echinoideorum TaxID=1549647 RepID=A0ABS5S5U0_9FLAO|nr:tetratricopeptide repeat protein [Aequorivita echinoideorum]MBT0608544.1 tetratricopeptide repeat protein [Aequorivita echinoideorum]
MATYNKRGGKPKTKVEKETVVEENSTTAEVFNTLDEGASKTEAWVEKNQKVILGVIGAVAVCVLGFFAYQEYVQKPKEAEAMNEMFQAQNYWEQALTAEAKDSLYNLSLKGGEGKYGFIEIIENYGGTNAANLAHYYAGMAYLNTNKYQEAIDQLDKFSSDDDILAPLAKGAIGDAFAQLGQNDEALKYYEEAATMRTNDFTTPRFLLKAGIAALAVNNNDKALKHFKTISDDYPKSSEATKAEVYTGRAEAMNQ